MLFMGMEVYSLQFTTLMRAVTMLAMGLVCTFCWKAFSPEKDIQDVENHAKMVREMKARRRALKAARRAQ